MSGRGRGGSRGRGRSTGTLNERFGRVAGRSLAVGRGLRRVSTAATQKFNRANAVMQRRTGQKLRGTAQAFASQAVRGARRFVRSARGRKTFRGGGGRGRGGRTGGFRGGRGGRGSVRGGRGRGRGRGGRSNGGGKLTQESLDADLESYFHKDKNYQQSRLDEEMDEYMAAGAKKDDKPQ